MGSLMVASKGKLRELHKPGSETLPMTRTEAPATAGTGRATAMSRLTQRYRERHPKGGGQPWRSPNGGRTARYEKAGRGGWRKKCREGMVALEEDADYSSNLEEAQSLQAERQAIAEKLQKDLETLSQEEIAKMQKDIQDKGKDLEFLAGKIQQAQEETAQQVFTSSGPEMQKIIGELIAAKQIKVLLAKNETMLFSDPALDLTDDVTSMLDVAAAAEANTQSE